MNYLKEIVIIGIGGAVGFAAGWYFSKRRAEKRADEEIDSVREYYAHKHLEETKKMKEMNAKIEEKILNCEKEYTEVEVKKEVLAEKESPEEDEPTKPYVITLDEFMNDMNEYDKISLNYYTYDDTLADDCDELIDIDETISSDIYNTLPSAEDDVYVRNPITQVDYEIMRIEASYKERYGGI